MSTPRLRWTGALAGLDADARRLLLKRGNDSASDDVRETTARILADVNNRGDPALFEMAERFDGARLEDLEVPRARWDDALATIDPDLRTALDRAARNVARVHEAQRRPPIEIEVEIGVIVGRWAAPLARVGVYVPGGRAAYASSVIMGVVPAKVAGVGEVIVCSPPQPDGLPARVVLAAAAIARADRFFAIGGAGAIGAMAYGTTCVPQVDRIVGPGNVFVAEAKRQVRADVLVDSPAGPSELLVVAGASVDAEGVAREMIAQAEHDPNATAVALVEGKAASEAVARAVIERASRARRPDAARALADRGAVLSVQSVDEALDFVTEFAPEHLLIATDDPTSLLPRVRGVGTVLLGTCTSGAFGDYLTGANHVLPTAGNARRASGLGLDDFMRWTTYQRVTREAAARLARDTAIIAEAEGLDAHAEAARAWGAPCST